MDMTAVQHIAGHILTRGKFDDLKRRACDSTCMILMKRARPQRMYRHSPRFKGSQESKHQENARPAETLRLKRKSK
eukprot:5783855-Amphidinium_carterae.1